MNRRVWVKKNQRIYEQIKQQQQQQQENTQ